MYGFVVTTAGAGLLARAAAGETLTLTGVQVGKGVAAGQSAALALTQLIDPVAAATSTAPAVAGGQLSMVVEYRNDMNGGLETGFSLSEFGIFARVGDDQPTLLYYAGLGDSPDPVLPESAGLDVHRYPVAVAVTGDVTVTLGYPADAFVSADELEDYVPVAQKGQPHGVASLDENGEIPAEQLPSTGRRYARVVVGTAAAGWTEKDCDFLCPGQMDHVTIGQALDALPEEGGEVVLLDGVYALSAPVQVDKPRVRLRGSGAATVLQAQTGYTGGIVVVRAADCSISRLTLDGNGAGVTCLRLGVSEAGADRGSVEDVTCKDGSTGISATGESGVRIRGCRLLRCGNYAINVHAPYTIVSGCTIEETGLYGIYADEPGCVIEGCTILGDAADPGSAGTGIRIQGVYGCTVRGCVCMYLERGVNLTAGTGCHAVVGNSFYANDMAIHLFNTQGCAVTGNAVMANFSCCIQLVGAGNNAVTGNVCSSSVGNGFYLDSGDYNTIGGNSFLHFSGGSQMSLRCGGNNNLVIGNNIYGKNYTDAGAWNTYVSNKYQEFDPSGPEPETLPSAEEAVF